MSTTKLARIGIAAATLALGVGALSTGAASASGGGSAVERRGLLQQRGHLEAEGQA